ncbi:hypothetical protein [Rubritalea tangerina]|uniref:hypothetical protein n=1 Tax=Rubritalea tangerina TaxID=430798 RepID=UPI003611A6A6
MRLLTLISILASTLVHADLVQQSRVKYRYSNIEGSQLYRSDGVDVFHTDEKLKHFSIGYILLPHENAMKQGFVSLMDLPPLKNDQYVTKVEKSVLHIQLKSTGTLIVSLPLQNLEPLIPRKN